MTPLFFTDSARSLGYGAVNGPYWFYGPFPVEWKTFNITYLELYPIVLAVHIWASLWKNHSILFFTDNLALVSVINSQTLKNPHIMKQLRVLILACLQNNILFQVRYIEGCKNVREVPTFEPEQQISARTDSPTPAARELFEDVLHLLNSALAPGTVATYTD